MFISCQANEARHRDGFRVFSGVCEIGLILTNFRPEARFTKLLPARGFSGVYSLADLGGDAVRRVLRWQINILVCVPERLLAWPAHDIIVVVLI